MLDGGDDAPEVSTENQDGETVTLDFSEPTVLYFYPRDDTPGCTVEAQQFDEELETYSDAGIDVYGISTDDVESHQEFRAKYDLDVDLLADPDGEVAAAFGVDTSNGAADRVTFVLDDGKVKKVYRGVTPDGHAREVLQDLLDEGVVTIE